MQDDDTQEIRMERQGWLTVEAAAEAALVSVHTVRAWIYKNGIETTKLGARRYVSRAALADKLGPIASRALGLAEEVDP